MVEPSTSDHVKRLSNFVKTARPFVSRREDLTLPYLPFVEILPALLDQPSLGIERTLSTNLQDRAELHYWAGLGLHRDQDVGPCRAHNDAPIKTYRLTGNIPGQADVLVEKTETYLTLASFPLGTLGDLQPLYRPTTEFPPALLCARSNCRREVQLAERDAAMSGTMGTIYSFGK
jgi:hypothetical protein